MARKSYKKRGTKLICIFCEGKTEENYFRQLIALERIKGANVKVLNPRKTDSLGLVKEAISFKNSKNFSKNDEIFCIFDIDDSSIKDIKGTIDLSKKHKIKLIISNPCFEYWILCHFEKYSSPISGREITSRLKKKFRGYKKGHVDLYYSIRGKTNNAIKNIKSVKKDLGKKKIRKNQNPSTDIHEFLQYLLSL